MNLTNRDFLRLVHKHGVDRILFATDSPWQDQADYIRRIKALGLSLAEEKQIFSQNARQLLGTIPA